MSQTFWCENCTTGIWASSRKAAEQAHDEDPETCGEANLVLIR